MILDCCLQHSQTSIGLDTSSTALTTISSATNGSRNKNGSEAVCGAARSLMRTWAKVRSWLIWAFYGFNCDQCRLETLESHQQIFKPMTPWSPKYPCGAIFRYLGTFFMFWTNPSPSSPWYYIPRGMPVWYWIKIYFSGTQIWGMGLIRLEAKGKGTKASWARRDVWENMWRDLLSDIFWTEQNYHSMLLTC